MADQAWPGGRAPHRIGQDIMARLEAEKPRSAKRTRAIIADEIAKWPGCWADMVHLYVEARLTQRRRERQQARK